MPLRVLLAFALLALPWPAPADIDLGPESGWVRVYYPAGECETGRLQVQLFDRDLDDWVDHPRHPRIDAGSCHREPPGMLLNELRVRCVDPTEGGRAPSTWVVGVRAAPPGMTDPC